MPRSTKRYWLLKSEPDVFSISDLRSRPNSQDNWDGVRSYQARNYIRDEMGPGQLALFYHSRTKEPGCVGLAKIVSKPFPDPLAFDSGSPYYDPRSDPENPRWFCVTVEFYKDFKRIVTLQTLKERPELAQMKVVAKGNRLSVMPVTKAEFDVVCRLGGAKA